MKKSILFAITLFSIFVLSACSKNNENVITSGNYIMELYNEQKNDEKIAPFIAIDTKQKNFTFSYDLLSSYFAFGTYEINDNILTATTSDEKYHYVFEIIDENTLSFVEESSSKITVFDPLFSVVPQNGAIFQKIEQ